MLHPLRSLLKPLCTSGLRHGARLGHEHARLSRVDSKAGWHRDERRLRKQPRRYALPPTSYVLVERRDDTHDLSTGRYKIFVFTTDPSLRTGEAQIIFNIASKNGEFLEDISESPPDGCRGFGSVLDANIRDSLAETTKRGGTTTKRDRASK